MFIMRSLLYYPGQSWRVISKFKFFLRFGLDVDLGKLVPDNKFEDAGKESWLWLLHGVCRADHHVKFTKTLTFSKVLRCMDGSVIGMSCDCGECAWNPEIVILLAARSYGNILQLLTCKAAGCIVLLTAGLGLGWGAVRELWCGVQTWQR